MVAPNLPHQLTSFVGRADELREIVDLLTDPGCRLLTLAGPGGIGKTRLAIQVAEKVQHQFADGVWFAALQPVMSAAFLVPALADALKFRFYGPEDPRIQLLRQLRDKEMLLVADNFEHLLDDINLLIEMLETAPRIKLLVTSRETLNVREEWVREVTGLRVPDSAQSVNIDSSDAVQLFVARARQTRGDFALDRDCSHVVEICRLVDGLPLAIELAATRVRTMSCEQIASELRRSMTVLETTLRNVPGRHRDMYAVFESCWDRLTQSQREVFMQLSVFRGGFTADAAAHVADASLPVLAVLVDKSLLRVTPPGRYEMHELVRQYAEARLAEVPGEIDHVRDRHCDYFAAFLAAREPRLYGADTIAALAEIYPEIDNIRAIWRWAVARKKRDALALALESVAFMYQNRDWYLEASEAFGAAVDALAATQPSTLVARLLAWQSNMVWSTDREELALELAVQSVEMLRHFGVQVANPVSFFFTLANTPDRWSETLQFFEKSLAAYRQQGNKWGIAATLIALGMVYEVKRRNADSFACFSESLTVFRELGNVWGQSAVLHGLHEVSMAQESYVAAEQYARECLVLCERLDDHGGIAIALVRVACALLGQGRSYEEARTLLERSIAIHEEHGFNPPWVWGWLGVLEYLTGNAHRAKSCFAKHLLRTAVSGLYDRTVEDILGALAAVFVLDGQLELAVEILVAIRPDGSFSRIVLADLNVNDLESRLSTAAFAAAKKRGLSKTVTDIAAEVLSLIEGEPESPNESVPVSTRGNRVLHAPLTGRELEVLRLVAEGLSNREIADKLVVTVGTVKKHLNNIFSKLHVRSRTEAVVQANKLDLLI